MASSGTARVEHFQLVDGMQLQINVSGSLNGPNVRIELRLKNCTRAWILHWGFVNHGNPNWFIPSEQSPGSKSYKQGALQTPFTKSGEFYVVNMELRGPKFHAIEFVLKDSCCNRWLKLNNGNFRVDLPEHDESTIHPSLSKDLIERKAYQIWESKGRPTSTPHQQKRDYDDAVRELQSQLAKGISLNELQSSCMSTSTKTLTDNRGQSRCALPPSYRRRHDVDQWLHKHSVGHAKSTNMPFSALMDLVERTNGGDKVISRQSYHVGNYEIVVLTKIVKSDLHVLVATNTKGAVVLHWGFSKLSIVEWLLRLMGMGKKLSNGYLMKYIEEKKRRKVIDAQKAYLRLATTDHSWKALKV
ncbi:hypothetical protein GH714_004747 [Hevea brasiliensis]|uniref:Uncharacterized protein n=1 Tax=Hevea brasiliensis TaxID=3981 RepID=A0A6A6NFM6_HEVBR|nr:hypothetical protein GH714_004747 [Hevea brasiliensis]